MSGNKSSIDKLIERLDAARGELQNGFRSCQQILASRFSLSESTDWVFMESVRSEAMSEVFLTMGKFAGRALRAFSFDYGSEIPEWDGLPPNDLEYYFWPGYDHLVHEQTTIRSTLRCMGPYGRQMPCGFGASLTDPGQRIAEPVATSLWYDAVLSQHLVDSNMTSKPIPPGSTHRWVTDRSLDKELPQHSLDNNEHFTYLEIGFQCDSAPSTGCISVNLADSTGGPKEWPTIISEQLKRISNWPVSADGEESKSSVRAIQKRCYALWLAVTLGIGKTGPDHEFKKDFGELVDGTTHILELIEARERCTYSASELVERIKTAMKYELSSNNSRPYRYWYSLPVDPTLDEHCDANSLGSFMLLSTHRIARPIIYMFSSWVHKIYSEIRLVESSALTTREVKAGKSQQFAHLIQGQVKTLVNALEFCSNERWKSNGLRVTRQQQFAVNMYGHTSRGVPRLNSPKPVDWKNCVLDAAFHAIRRLTDRSKSDNAKPLDAALLASLQNDSKNKKRDLLEKAMKRSVSLKTEEWLDVSEEHLTEFAEQIGGRSILHLNQLSTQWGNDVFEGLLTYVLTQSFFHGAVFSRSMQAVREILPELEFKETSTYMRVQFTKNSATSSEICIANRAFIEVADFEASTDYQTLQTFQTRFNQTLAERLHFRVANNGRKERWFKTIFTIQENDQEIS